MTGSRKPVSFVATAIPDKAAVFYRDILGLKLVESGPYALVFDDGTHMLRVQIVTEFSPPTYTAHGWQVTDIEKEIAVLTANGVECLTFDQLEQNATGVWTTPDGNKIAWFKDPDGNILSFTEVLTQIT